MQKIVRLEFVVNDGDNKDILLPESRKVGQSSVDLQPGIAVEIVVPEFGVVRIMLLHKHQALLELDKGLREIAQNMAPPHDIPDGELPGMWESADFAGGAPEDNRESAVCPFCRDTMYAPPRQDPLKHHIDYCPSNPNSDTYGMPPMKTADVENVTSDSSAGYKPPSKDLIARQMKWERENPEPKHAPYAICNCPMPWRERDGKGHCAARFPLNAG